MACNALLDWLAMIMCLAFCGHDVVLSAATAERCDYAELSVDEQVFAGS